MLGSNTTSSRMVNDLIFFKKQQNALSILSFPWKWGGEYDSEKWLSGIFSLSEDY